MSEPHGGQPTQQDLTGTDTNPLYAKALYESWLATYGDSARAFEKWLTRTGGDTPMDDAERLAHTRELAKAGNSFQGSTVLWVYEQFEGVMRENDELRSKCADAEVRVAALRDIASHIPLDTHPLIRPLRQLLRVGVE